jgi:hypothetical protein
LKAAFALLALLLPGSARADTMHFADVTGGLRLDVYTWEGAPCVVTPAGADRAHCAATDDPSVAVKDSRVQAVGAAVVHFPDWELRVLATHPAAGAVAADEITPEAMLKVARQTVPLALPAGVRASADGVPADDGAVQWNDGIPFVRASPTVEGDARAGSALVYTIASGDGVYGLSFVADQAHAADVAKIGDNAIASLSGRRPRAPNRAYRTGYAAGRIVRVLFFGLVTVPLFIWRVRRRTAAQRGV